MTTAMKPKLNRKPGLLDCCQTPAYALDPLLPYLCKDWTIWECAAGECILFRALMARGYGVIGTDILFGQDFLDECQPGSHWDCIVTNPPYSRKYEWLERCYSFEMPFALLMPVEMLGAARAQRQFIRYGLELILLDKRVNFKMPNKGYQGNGAQFPVAWYTWGLNIGRQVTFATITRTESE